MGVGTASAQVKTYRLGAGSGAQAQIGGGLPLPIQLTDVNMDMIPDWGAAPTTGIMVGSIPATVGVGAGVFPPLLIPIAPFATVMGTTGMTMGQALTVPAGALSRGGVQKTLGVNSQNSALFAVATNLSFKAPAATAMFSARTMTKTFASGAVTLPKNATTVYTAMTAFGPGTAMIRYLNPGVASPYGGPAPPRITQNLGSGLKPSEGVTVYAILPPTAPPCAGPGCNSLILKADATGTQALGGKALNPVFTLGGNVAPPDIYNVVAGSSPKGTIVTVVAPVGTGAPTNMASSAGFFFTTGRITVSVAGALVTPERFVLSGTDLRSAGGEGVIQLVAGALSQRALSGPNGNRAYLRLEIQDALETAPTVPEWGLMALFACLLGGAMFMMRRRRTAEVSA